MSADSLARAHVNKLVAKSGSSFLIGMRVLPPPRRAAMHALYAFCREVDDIADGPGTAEEKLAALAEWRRELALLYEGRATQPTARMLQPAIEAHGLPCGEFLEILEGMEMDAAGPIVAPSRDELTVYCRRVAVAVGQLSLLIFGAPKAAASGLAVELGTALQLTNILRDLSEDAEQGRLYLPAELLEAAGVGHGAPRDVLADPALPEACRALAKEARAHFDSARGQFAGEERRALRPAAVMMAVYESLLDRLERRGWHPPLERPRIPTATKAWLMLRHGLF